MGRSPARAASRWESGIQESAPEAIDEYNRKLEAAATKFSSTENINKMKTNYANAIADAGTAYSAAMTPQRAGEAYKQRLEQIATGGFTAYQKGKIESVVAVRQHLSTILGSVVNLLKGATTGNPTFKASNLDDSDANFIANKNMALRSNNYTTGTTASEVIADFKANYSSLKGIIAKT